MLNQMYLQSESWVLFTLSGNVSWNSSVSVDIGKISGTEATKVPDKNVCILFKSPLMAFFSLLLYIVLQ